MHQLSQAERSWHKARRKLLIMATISRENDASVVTGHRLLGLEEDLGLAGLDARTLANLEGDGLAGIAISSTLAAVGSPAPKSSPVMVPELPPVVAKSIVAADAADTSKLKTGLATTPTLTADSPNTVRIELLGHEDVRRLAGLEEGHKFESQLRVDVRKLARIEAGHKSAGQAASTLAGLEAGLVLA
jgi:hypothetical protein